MRAMCRQELKDGKGAKDLMLMSGLNETIDHLAMGSSVRWHGHVLMMAFDFEVEGQRKKGRLKRTWKKQVEEERCEGWFEQGKCTFPTKMDFWE